jgi:aminodeoxyfutalosine synthase
MSTTELPPMTDPKLDAIRETVLTGRRIDLDDAMALYETPDIWGLCALAHEVRTRLYGPRTSYNVNRHINYTNVCALSCRFCGFYRKKGQEGAYTHDMARIEREAREAVEAGATEIHIVGGLHPYEPFSYYTDMLRTIRRVADDAGSSLHIKAFTAVEIVHFARIAGKGRDKIDGIRWVLEQLIEAGLGSLPGGGAEVFDDQIHDEAFKGKIRADAWLDVHHVAHELGLNTNATILYGHIESRSDRLRHMDLLRTAQDTALARLGYTPDNTGAITLTRPDVTLPNPTDQTGFFQTITPLPFIPDGSALEHLPGPGGLENLRTLAICRLVLDNVPHVKAFWIMQSLPMAQLMIQAGADDIDGTVVWYDITKITDDGTHQETTSRDLERTISEVGLTPVERDTLYRPIVRDGVSWQVEPQTA